jgi:hypothetical protein
VTSWQNEVWYEKGVSFFYHYPNLATNGYVLFGEFLIRIGDDLAKNSFLVAGF